MLQVGFDESGKRQACSTGAVVRDAWPRQLSCVGLFCCVCARLGAAHRWLAAERPLRKACRLRTRTHLPPVPHLHRDWTNTAPPGGSRQPARASSSSEGTLPVVAAVTSGGGAGGKSDGGESGGVSATTVLPTRRIEIVKEVSNATQMLTALKPSEDRAKHIVFCGSEMRGPMDELLGTRSASKVIWTMRSRLRKRGTCSQPIWA